MQIGMQKLAFFSKMHTKHHLDSAAADSGKLGFIVLTYSEKKFNFQYFEYNENNESATTPIGRIRRINFNIPFEQGNIRFLGSCNGLICLALQRKYYICNPITREYIIIPELKRIDGVTMDGSMRGFLYVSSTNEYKVVSVMYWTEFTELHVYTLGSGHGWRNLGKINFGTPWDQRVFVNGALYWLNCGSRMIVTFDLAEEKFCEHLSLPLPPDDAFRDAYQLGVLDGCLYFAAAKIVDGDFCRDMWLLKKQNHNDGMKELEGHQSLGWGEVFRISDRVCLFATTKSYDLLTCNGNQINIHLSEALTSKTILDFEGIFTGVFPHKNTLVSLKVIGEEDTKVMESVEIA